MILIPLIITLTLGIYAYLVTREQDPYGLNWIVRGLFSIPALIAWIAYLALTP